MNINYKIEEMKQDIRYYKKLIASAEDELRRLNKQLEELNELYRKYLKVRDQYGEFQYRQEQQVSALNSKFRNIKFSKKLSKNIADELHGSSAKKSSAGIDKTIHDIEYKSRQTEEAIQDERNKIHRYNATINDLEYDIRQLQYQLL